MSAWAPTIGMKAWCALSLGNLPRIARESFMPVGAFLDDVHAWLTSGKCRFDRFRNRLSNTLRGRQQHEDDHPGNGRAVDARDASVGATKRNHAGLRDYVWQRCWNAKRFNTGRAGYRDRARECGARCHVRVQNFTASAGANCNCGQHDDGHNGQVDDDQSRLRISCEAWIVIRTCPFIKAWVSLTR